MKTKLKEPNKRQKLINRIVVDTEDYLDNVYKSKMRDGLGHIIVSVYVHDILGFIQRLAENVLIPKETKKIIKKSKKK